ncbi:MAG: hypothetical protein DHS20C14_11390 [Phycisphaeraceae bacterium]|nr:MAG: hypothetical protein DHS20C14_11390 [Phycisphaeraceae bacterium]
MRAMQYVMALACAAGMASAQTTVVDFESGNEGWDGPQGIGGATFIDPTGGNGGSAGLHTQFNNFGIEFATSTNSDFLGNYTTSDEITISFDLKIDQIGFSGLNIARPFMLELRNNDLGDPGYPWASAYLLFDWYTDSADDGFITLSTTFNPNDTDVPAGWGGNGAFDPVTFAPKLPDGVTFADVLSGVDEIAISTFLPDYFFTFDDYDVTVDNISITRVPAPASAFALLGMGIVGTRRRR